MTLVGSLDPARGIMAAIAAHKLQIIQTLVETAPDAALRSLELALSSAGSQGALASVRDLVEDETANRFVRNNVLAPIVPLCARRVSSQVSFPAPVLPRLWRALKSVAAARVEEAAARCNPWDLEQGSPEVFDELCKLAAAGLRDPENAAFDSVRSLCDPEQLALCLQLSTLTRGCLPKLAEWVSRMSDERAAAARLAYRDACRISEDAGPLLLDILSAHLPDDWRIMRVISAVMDRPTDRYLASSEVSQFGERILTEIDETIALIESFSFADGEKVGRQAAQAAQKVQLQMVEIQQSVDIAKDGPWGKRLARQKQAMAKACELRMDQAEKELDKALPTRPISMLAKKGARGVAKLLEEPDEAMIRRAQSALAFVAELRACADKAGYGSSRTKVLEKLNARLDPYIEDVLHVARTGEGGDSAVAVKYLDIAASFIAYTRDDKTAEIVRRRAAAAIAA
ncbi:hypothetical protein OVA11_16960 [Caulobacter sp. SL161]|uniref:hypothetical protein n=1 Tax=Caulobacter sp. SL161 TaxID=2995156 RepID=UPI0022732E9B|nr:hypothetical protein [Caulobacter sp. SL161]MCY1648689.1 hypothetical protein [Caulobacter sp. SL161]